LFLKISNGCQREFVKKFAVNQIYTQLISPADANFSCLQHRFIRGVNPYQTSSQRLTITSVRSGFVRSLSTAS